MQFMMSDISIDSREYYSTYYGHKRSYLECVHHELRGNRSVIWFAGDSSLDNKYWFSNSAAAVNGYEKILKPPIMKQDVCYFVNKLICERKLDNEWLCINTAVEATALNSRPFCSLLDQDKMIRDNISKDDVLVVSIGGNDIALMPTLMTILNILSLVCCTPSVCIDKCACACPPNLHTNAGCYCCGIDGCISGLFGWPIGIGYFVDMFKNKISDYIKKIISKTKPRKVVVTMIYYPDEQAGGSWADGSLSLLCYNSNPYKLQLMIRKIFELATMKIDINGTEVIPLPWFEMLDGSNTNDYLQRVEPSPQGSEKMAKFLLDSII